jgi:hypothetical protein
MKRSELKKLIKPLVKECIHETLFEDGLLSGIVSEVAQGLGGGQVIKESSRSLPSTPDRSEEVRREQTKRQRKQLLDAIGKDAFNGVDLFEGTTPAPPERKSMGQGDPLAGQDPDDPGVDITGIMALGGKNWGALLK